MLDLVHVIMPTFSGNVTVPSFLGSLDKFHVRQFLVRWASFEVVVDASYVGDIVLKKDMAVLKKTDLFLSVHGSAFNFSLGVDIELMNAITVRAEIAKNGAVYDASFWSTKPVYLMDLFSNHAHFQETLKQYHLESLVVEDISGSMQITKSLGFTYLRLSGAAKLFNVTSVELDVILSRAIDEHVNSSKPAWSRLLTFCASNVNLVQIIKNLFNVDVSKIPVLGSLSLQSLSVMLASGSVKYLQAAAGPHCSSGGLSPMEGPGMQLIANFLIESKPAALKLTISGGKLKAVPVNVTLPSLVHLFFPFIHLSSIHLPKGFPRLSDVTISFLKFDTEARKASIEINLGSFHLPGRIITCRTARLRLGVDYSSKPYNMSMAAFCKGTLLSQEVEHAISLSKGNAHFRTTFPRLVLREMFRHGRLASTPIKHFLESLGLLKLTLLNVTLQIDTHPQRMSISGIGNFANKSMTAIELLVLKPFQSVGRKVIFGTVIPKIKIIDLLNALFRKMGVPAIPDLKDLTIGPLRLLALPKTVSRTFTSEFADKKLSNLLKATLERMPRLGNLSFSQGHSITTRSSKFHLPMVSALFTLDFAGVAQDVITLLSATKLDFQVGSCGTADICANYAPADVGSCTTT